MTGGKAEQSAALPEPAAVKFCSTLERAMVTSPGLAAHCQGPRGMHDTECTAFLQWALPRLELRWAGFRKVRKQVCKRLKRRLHLLGLPGFAAYRDLLAANPEEWRVVDACCRITISRFFRDRQVFDTLCDRVLPELRQRAISQQRNAQCWSAGCASGEEPYTLRILWDFKVGGSARLSIVATDADDTVLARARRGCYPAASLRELPPDLLARGFREGKHCFCIHEQHRQDIIFAHHDLRSDAMTGIFDLILCRNLAFTYFAPRLQCHVLKRLADRLRPQGWLVIGAHERLPEAAVPHLIPLATAPHIFARV
jgi:chemotaxis protein methyltransferase CheR